jgi:hypothetical protein
MRPPKFEIGDLVRFDSYGNTMGVVTNIKNSSSFDPPEKVADILVYWADGEEFWCLDFTLVLISRYKTN